jgi:hypothetical protein
MKRWVLYFSRSNAQAPAPYKPIAPL